MQGKIFDCDAKFAVVFGCLQVHSIIGKDVVDFIPSIIVSDNDNTSTQVFLFCEFLMILCCISISTFDGFVILRKIVIISTDKR